MNRRLAAAALVLLALPQLVLARPAVVRVFEAEARGAPSRDAPVVQTFPERAEVSVSEDATDGWRRVRLRDGSTGFIEDSALALQAEAVGALPAGPPPPPPAPVPDLRPRVYLKDLDHMASIMEPDPRVGPMARSLVDRQKRAWVVGGVGLAVFTGLSLAGLSQMSSYQPSPNDPNAGGPPPGTGLVIGGMVTGLVAGIAAAVIYPKQGEFLDVVNTWNAAHPEQQVQLWHVAGMEPAHVHDAVPER